MPERLGLKRRAMAVKGTRSIGNYRTADGVGAQSYEVRAVRDAVDLEPVKVLPLVQRDFLF